MEECAAFESLQPLFMEREITASWITNKYREYNESWFGSIKDEEEDLWEENEWEENEDLRNDMKVFSPLVQWLKKTKDINFVEDIKFKSFPRKSITHQVYYMATSMAMECRWV